jgi:hypothetical protein
MRIAALLLLTASLWAAPGDWEALQSLAGTWVGEGSGSPGEAAGYSTFEPDLQGKIFVRHNHASYPATKDRPAFDHDDLMIVYRPAPGQPMRAIYFDNEDHVIHYGVEVSPDGNRIVFVSDAGEPGPRFRFTYSKLDADRLGFRFEIAPPGKPGEFAKYIDGEVRRAKPGDQRPKSKDSPK